ncbi:response regulator transcription factor [Nonomuraea sp. K274]|uniref:Response regulator transcription factor n=1 Tax=Nonomuraea cypriaca TaxID=1187855 RepID=A0A931F4C9_9ACTN|nr:response regulator transcription factor [Nonomuraea cypriaca]MBF8193535.1 response regulator transcription factor [Nonomuraea cypriaca]
MIRVLLADDQPLVRAGFAALLSGADDVEIVGEAGDGLAAIEQTRAARPDVVLMDIRMPRMDGLEATRAILASPVTAEVKVVILTTFEMDEYVFEALQAGAAGFLVKHSMPDELINAVRVAAAGEAILSPSVTRRLIAEYTRRAKPPPGNHGHRDELTDREREVVILVGQGLGNEEIAAALFLSTATIRSHVSRAMMKLDVRNRAQLVVFAYETGLVSPGWDHRA